MRSLLRSFLALLLLLGGVVSAHAQLVADVADAPVRLAPPQIEQAGKRATFSYASAVVSQAFNGVAVQGFSTDPAFELQIRFETADGWSPWSDLFIVRSSTDPAFLAAYRGEVYREGQRFELRFSVEAGTEIQLVGAGVFDSRRDADRGGSDLVPVPEAGTRQGALLPPVMVNRAAWGARPFIGDPIPLARPSYDYLTFHHAAGFGGMTLQEGMRQVKAIQVFHQDGRGWSDIGYQFVMDQSGRLYQGRPFLDGPIPLKDVPRLAQGAHVGGNNTGNIGVCVLGCYHPPEGSFCRDAMTPAALDSLVTMFAFLSEAYDVPEENLRGHRDWSSTACPGDNNYALIPTIRQRVEDLKRTGNQPLGTAILAAVADDAGVVRLSWQFTQAGGVTSYRIERVDEEHETVVFEGQEALSDGFVDAGVGAPGTVTYRLVGLSTAGREQILAVSEVTVEAPDSFVLAHNFPNPFRQSTTIRYFLRQDGIVELAVYDVTGRRVTTLQEGFQSEGQWYARSFDARDLPGGTYFYRIRVDGFGGIVYDEARAVTLIR